MIELSYVGDKVGLLKYLQEKKDECPDCNDTGICTKTEWTDDDVSYDVEVRCVCSED